MCCFFIYTFFLDIDTFITSEKLDITRDANDKEGADATEFINNRFTINIATWPFEIFSTLKSLCWEYSGRLTITNTCYNVYNLLHVEYQKMQHAMF